MSNTNGIANACELAGFFAAHTAWSLADGELPSPITALLREDGTRAMQRLIGDDLPRLVEAAEAWLGTGPDDAAAAALVYAGELARVDGRDDAIIVEWASYAERDDRATFAILYRTSPFALGPVRVVAHTPRVLEADAVDAFLRGVGQHDKAGPAWRAAITEWRG